MYISLFIQVYFKLLNKSNFAFRQFFDVVNCHFKTPNFNIIYAFLLFQAKFSEALIFVFCDIANGAAVTQGK